MLKLNKNDVFTLIKVRGEIDHFEGARHREATGIKS